MISPRERPSFNAVILEFLDSVPKPDRASVTAWMRRYPEYAAEIAEFSAAWVLSEVLPDAHLPRPTAEVLTKQGMTILERALYQDPPEEKGGTQPIEDLLEEAKRRGLTVQRLALVVGLSPALITKLCRRLIRFESIPRLVFNRIAEALEHTVQAVERCLQQPPMLARAASHRAEKAPTVMAPEDFFHAVREDRGLTATQRAYWLAQVQKTTEKPPQ